MVVRRLAGVVVGRGVSYFPLLLFRPDARMEVDVLASGLSGEAAALTLLPLLIFASIPISASGALVRLCSASFPASPRIPAGFVGYGPNCVE